MTKLTLLRHAIAQDKLTTTHQDIDRPLTSKWRKQTLKYLQDHYDTLQDIDLVLCSNATRARQTCHLLASVIDIDPALILYKDNIYDLSWWAQALREIIQSIPTKTTHVCLVWHNGSISALASELAWTSIHMKKWTSMSFSISL